MDQMDEVDIYGTFTATEAIRVGMAPLEEAKIRSTDNVVISGANKGV